MTRPLSVDAATPHSVVAKLAHEAWEANYPGLGEFWDHYHTAHVVGRT